jgi:hypothetical protein
MTENNLKEIKEFINSWKLRAINYYHQAIEDFKKEYKELIEKYSHTNYDYRKEKRQLFEKYNQIVLDLSFGYSSKDREERLLKIIERDATLKEKTLIARVNKEVGLIVKALNLKVGLNGELNGTIKGENGICKIETIYAGGYNIQCLHYRVLVHRVNA